MALILLSRLAMTAPRLITPGTTYLITRRCTQRQFLLRPSVETNRIFLYCLAFAAEETGIELHAFVQMSNHWHGILTDPEARLPQFLQIFHRLVAVAMNKLLDRQENFWASGHTSVVALPTGDDVIEQVARVMANPTTAGLVRSPHDWPGIITQSLGEHRVVQRPAAYFCDFGVMPARVELRCSTPPMLRDLAPETLARRLRAHMGRLITQATCLLRAAGKAFLGLKRVLATSVWRSAPDHRVRRESPEVIARDPVVHEASIARLRGFRARYWLALERWRCRDRSAKFPHGTYLMRVLHAAFCGSQQAS